MYQTSGRYVSPVALPLEDGGLLGSALVTWHAYGERQDDNVVVLLHDLVHSPDALASPPGPDFRPSGWATELVGEGRPLDTDSLHVVVPSLLGSPFGASSPVSVNPQTGSPYGAKLPPLTVLDQARAVAALLRGLGVERARAVVGVGLGGMVALRLAALFPERMASTVVLGAAYALPESLRERLAMAHHALRMDADFHDGDYALGAGPRRTVRKQALEYLRLASASLPGDEPALEAEAQALADTFDANAWALLCTAYAGAELTEDLAEVRAPVLLAAGSGDALAPPSRVRDTYHQLSAAGVRAYYHELPEPCAHRGLLTEARRLRGPLRDFLRLSASRSRS